MNTDIASLIKNFSDQGGHWPAALDPLLETSPDFVRAYVAFAERPYVAGPLPPKVKALVKLALHASMTTLYEPGIRDAIRSALKHGASQAELLEALELISVIGVHACVIGVPIMVQKLAAHPDKALDLSNSEPVRAAIKSEFTQKRGYWSEIWDGTLALDPEFFQAFTTFSSVPWVGGVLEPKVKEFMYIAVDVSSTHMYVPGTHVHIENALKFGATPAELLEVMQLASVMGLSSFEVALPILMEEIQAVESVRA